MSGAIVEYLVGLYFIGVALNWDGAESKVSFNFGPLVFGIVMVVLAVIGFSPVH